MVVSVYISSGALCWTLVRTANPDTRNRARDHLIAAQVYSQMLCQLSYVRLMRYRTFNVNGNLAANTSTAFQWCFNLLYRDLRVLLAHDKHRYRHPYVRKISSQPQAHIYTMLIRIKWTHWGLNPGPSACEADVIPLHHAPNNLCDACLQLFISTKPIYGFVLTQSRKTTRQRTPTHGYSR